MNELQTFQTNREHKRNQNHLDPYGSQRNKEGRRKQGGAQNPDSSGKGIHDEFMEGQYNIDPLFDFPESGRRENGDRHLVDNRAFGPVEQINEQTKKQANA